MGAGGLWTAGGRRPAAIADESCAAGRPPSFDWAQPAERQSLLAAPGCGNLKPPAIDPRPAFNAQEKDLKAVD